MNEKKKIVITLEGGLIQWIEGIPDGMVIEVRDYDVEGADESELETGENGDLYYESIWEKEHDDGGT